MLKNILLFCFLTCCFFSCNNKNTTQEKNITIPTNSNELQTLPSLSQNDIDSLMNHTDYIDIIFHGYGKSISFNEKTGIQNMIRQLSIIPQIDLECAAPFGKIIYYKMPDKLLEGEIHYGNGCAYFVFPNTDGQPQYSNKMGSTGIAFFNDIISQFNNAAAK